MSRVYISFLGTNDYLPCTYFHDERELQNIRFVQEATLHFFCDEWDNNDRILIFTTNESYQANWLDNGHKDRKTGEIKKCNGLEYCIEKFKLQAEVQQIFIPKGQSEQEIWEIFQIVYGWLKSGDEVIFDITHAFRSIPMLAITIFSKKIENKENDWFKPASENRPFINKMLKLIKQDKDAAAVVDKLRPFRNDLNHAAFIDLKFEPKSANSFNKKLRDEVADIESFFIKRKSR